ncbi:hypothetical protein L6452_27922 [Arctium lappa]|uniref:Uncharacterized protein n=1 Tax=Arctium lappa TaxID=4217 RepID=A0ACB8ZXU8_ARCLA|nr:hypothetical protein L6452_27922 [Arctium lappa]
MSNDMFGGGEFDDSIPKEMNNIKDVFKHINSYIKLIHPTIKDVEKTLFGVVKKYPNDNNLQCMIKKLKSKIVLDINEEAEESDSKKVFESTFEDIRVEEEENNDDVDDKEKVEEKEEDDGKEKEEEKKENEEEEEGVGEGEGEKEDGEEIKQEKVDGEEVGEDVEEVVQEENAQKEGDKEKRGRR